MSGTEGRLVPDRLANSLRGFGPIGILVSLIILLAGPAWFRGILVFIWARLWATAYAEFGYVRPRSWSLTLIFGVALGVTFKLLMKVVVMPILSAPPVNQ